MYQTPIWQDAQHNAIVVLINGVRSIVPVNAENADYAEIMRLVAAEELTIAEPE